MPLILATSMLVIGSSAQSNQVQVAGAMRNVMMKGDLCSAIYLDTIRNRSHLFGIGPNENLQGEILIIDGTAYRSSIDTNQKIKIEKGFNLKAPFFVYANVQRWHEHALPDTVKTLEQLDSYLTNVFASTTPFAFKLTGKVNQANIHVVNLPTGTQIKSSNDAHLGQVDVSLTDVDVVMIGFFSTQHKRSIYSPR